MRRRAITDMHTGRRKVSIVPHMMPDLPTSERWVVFVGSHGVTQKHTSFSWARTFFTVVARRLSSLLFTLLTKHILNPSFFIAILSFPYLVARTNFAHTLAKTVDSIIDSYILDFAENVSICHGNLRLTHQSDRNTRNGAWNSCREVRFHLLHEELVQLVQKRKMVFRRFLLASIHKVVNDVAVD